MPSPPITIGELTDVPAFDSPIASPWAQEVSRRVAHRFATAAERDAKYPAATAGAGAVCAVAGDLFRSTGTRWIGSAFAGLVTTVKLPLSLPSGSWQGIYWATPPAAQDPFGMLSAADSRRITIPYTGRWSITFSCDSSPGPTAAAAGVVTTTQGIWAGSALQGLGSWGASWVMWLAAGEVIQCSLYQGATTNFSSGGVHVLSLGGV